MGLTVPAHDLGFSGTYGFVVAAIAGRALAGIAGAKYCYCNTFEIV